jgi:integrase
MPRVKLTKSAIDALPTPKSDVVYWDTSLPGFGVKVTPKGRKVFVVLYRTGGAGSKLRKYTIGPYGRVTLHHARIAAQRVFVAKLDGRDPAAEKREANRRIVADRVDDILERFITQHLSQNRSGAEIARLLRRELEPWKAKSIHEIRKRDVVDVVSAIDERGAPAAANKTLKSIKKFLRWCAGQAIIEQSPADDVPLPAKTVSRDRVLSDEELVQVLRAARIIGDPYCGIVELLTLTGQRREEVARMQWEEVDLPRHAWTVPGSRTKNAKSHAVHLSRQSIAVLDRLGRSGPLLFSISGSKPFQAFSLSKRLLDKMSGITGWRLHDLRRTCVSGMARIGIAPHVADKVLNHQSGTISGVAAVYQRHDFLAEREEALERWGAHIEHILNLASQRFPNIWDSLLMPTSAAPEHLAQAAE